MPKKTKKEKRIADMRHKLSTATHSFPSSGQTISPSVSAQSSPYSFRSQSSTQNTTPAVYGSDEYGPIKLDLAKTMMLAAAAVIIELLLYMKIGR